MKAFVAMMSFCLIVNTSVLAQYLNNSFIEISGDSCVIHAVAFFPFGAGSNCPSLQSYVVVTVNDTVKVNLNYDISGFWPQDYCVREDMIYLLDLNYDEINNLLIIANRVVDHDTTFNVSHKDFTFSLVSAAPTHLSEDISLYPNPATEAVTIKFAGATAEKADVTISDMYGRRVKRLEVTQQQEVQVPVAELPAGVYYCRVSSGGKVQVIKFVKQ